MVAPGIVFARLVFARSVGTRFMCAQLMGARRMTVQRSAIARFMRWLRAVRIRSKRLQALQNGPDLAELWI